jgi:hypothetical protein
MTATDQLSPAPERQLTGCPFGDAIGTLAEGTEVAVAVGGWVAIAAASTAVAGTVVVAEAAAAGFRAVEPTRGQLHAKISMAASENNVSRRFCIHPPCACVNILCQMLNVCNMPSVPSFFADTVLCHQIPWTLQDRSPYEGH